MPVLTILQVLTARAIAAPIVVTAPMIQVAPTAAARALSVMAIPGLTKPVTIRLQCVVPTGGRFTDCIPADTGGTRDIVVYRQRLFATSDRARTDPLLAAALDRMAFYRIRSLSGSARVPATVLIDVTLSPTDRVVDRPPTGIIERRGADVEVDPSFNFGNFYPPAALRDGAETRVSATCRVLDDRSLFCRDPHVDLPTMPAPPPMWRIPRHDSDFDRATLQALAAMRVDARTKAGEPSVGRDMPASVAWALP